MFCSKCGASMPDDSAVCPQCATPVQGATLPPQPPPPPQAATPTPASTSAWLNVPPAKPIPTGPISAAGPVSDRWRGNCEYGTRHCVIRFVSQLHHRHSGDYSGAHFLVKDSPERRSPEG